MRRASKRASETPEETINRQEQSRMHMASLRASKTSQQSLCRQETDKVRKTSNRASETSQQVLQRKEADKCHVSNKRNRSVTIEHAISEFHSETKGGPDFVCTCCHRMMYRKSVVQCKKSKYTKTSIDVLQKVFSTDFRYFSNDGKLWICKTCDRALSRGSVPLQAKADGLQLSEIPPELSGLNPLELRLILPTYTIHENGSSAIW